MRTMLLALLLAVSFTAAAQEWKSPLPVDSATQKITYQAVVQVPGATQIELYSRALNWFTNSFGPSVASLENASIPTSTITADGYAPFDYVFMGKGMPWAMWRRIKIEAKEGRYRYTITDFELGGPLDTPASTKSSADRWLAPYTKKTKKPSKMVQSVLDGIEQTTAAEIASLQARMSATATPAPAKKEKDW